MSQSTTKFSKPVIAIVGAGSIVWGRRIVVDLMSHPDLADAEIRLIDTVHDRLTLVHEWCEFAREFQGGGQRITAHTHLEEGLREATACLTAISVGGDRLWRYDATHPQLDGIFQPVGDTTGPGGAMRALRHASPLRRIGETLARVGEPGAVLLQLTNPLNALTACLEDIEGIRVFGFCHGYEDTERIFGQTLFPRSFPNGIDPHSPWREEVGRVEVELAGNNHFVFVDRLHLGDRTYDQQDLEELTPRIFDGPFREAVWSRYGVLTGNFPRHPIEFLPGFIHAGSGFGREWGVEPVANEINPLHGERHDRMRDLIEEHLRAARRDAGTVARWDLRHSNEPIDAIVAAFHSGKSFYTHLNLHNQGAIRGVSDDLHLEMFCEIKDGGVIRPSVSLPEAILPEIERVGRCQILLSECCRSYSEEKLLASLSEDALTPKDDTVLMRLIREMVAFQREWIFPED